MKARWMALTVVAVCILAPRAAHADGVAWSGRDYSALAPLTQNEQMAAIAHRDGIESMVIAISADLAQEDKALWMFPVPGTPDQVKLDVVDVFPLFEGYDPRQTARLQIRSLGRALTATQIYPALFRLGTVTQGRAYPLNAGGVFVHEVAEKWGIHAETVKAASEQELARYIEKQGVGMPRGELAAFEDYLGEDYVLVLVWIASWEEALQEFPRFWTPQAWDADRWPCVHVQFPTERPFYPLRPTASYGDAYLKITLFLEGYFEVANAEQLGYLMLVNHFRHKGWLPGVPDGFRPRTGHGYIPYTRVWIGETAGAFTEDLWFTPVRPPGMRYGAVADAILSREHTPWSWFYPWALCLAGLSYVSAGLASLVVYRSWRRRALIGFWNMLTIVGLGIAVFTRPAADNRARNLRGLFFLAFAFLFLALSSLLEVVLLWPLG